MKEICSLRAKTWAYLMEDGSEHKKAKGTKKCVIKRRLMSKTIQILCLMMKSYYNHSKDLKVIVTMYILNK